ncbi:MAG: tetratricopeptide (TPR) repeat protein [Myxococcota bacterium]|jgi:tetratricopeptide (TPR) repeat protein
MLSRSGPPGDNASVLKLLLFGLIGGVLCALVGQLTAPYHLLTHEFTQVFTLACGVGLMLLPRRLPGPPTQRLLTTLAMAGALGVGAYLTQHLLGSLWHDCRTIGTGAYFWVTWPPMALFAAVIGVMTVGWSDRRVLGLLGVLGLVDGANLGLQGLYGVRAVDLFMGDLIGFSQRIEMVTTEVHLRQRLWLVGVALTLWSLHRQAPVLLSALLGVPLLAATLLAGSHLGLGPGRSALHSQLDGEHSTEHFRFRYVSTGRAMLYLDTISENAEWQWHRLQSAWDLDDDTIIEVRVFEDYDHLTALTGYTSAHAGPHWMNIPWWTTMGTTFEHELVHTINVDLTWNPRLILLRGHLEGMATAWEDDLALLPEAHTTAAGALASEQLPPADVFMDIGGFTRVNESNAYEASASFVGWLILKQGFADYTRLQRTLDYTGIYGADLAGLDGQWRAFLATVPTDLEDTAKARESFDPVLSPAYRSQTCPKLGPKREPGHALAERRLYAGDYAGAYADYAALLQDDDSLRWVFPATTCLQQLGRDDEALTLLDRPLDDLADDERARLLRARTISLLHRADFPALAETYAARLTLESDPDRAILAACLADPTIQAPLAEALSMDGWWSQQAIQDLARRHPEHDGLRHILATRGLDLTVSPYALSLLPAQRVRLAEALALLSAAPDACEPIADTLLATASGLQRLGEDDLLDATLPVLSQCSDPRVTLRADRIAERRAWAAQR